ncbi:MAG: FAD-binding protein, partial [Candidatus Binataceae bacterium]
IPRLYAAGEVAMTGLHGANRLASNSLLEAAVMGRRGFATAHAMLRHDRAAPPEFPEWDPGNAIESEQRVLITQSWEEIRRLMWNYVGIVRSDLRLARALRRIRMLDEEIHGYYWDHRIDSDLIELRNLVAVGELIVRCALARKESRGLHYTIDYPDHDDGHWLQATRLSRADAPSAAAVQPS